MRALLERLRDGPQISLLLGAAAASMLLSLAIAVPVLHLRGAPLTDEYVTTLLGTSVAVASVTMLVVLGLLREDRRRSDRVAERNRDLTQMLRLKAAMLDTTRDGILVVDRHDRPVIFNQRFAELWRLPPSLAQRARDDPLFRAAEFRAAVLHLLENPDAYLEKVHAIYADPEATGSDTLFFKDGQRLRRFTAPQRVDGEIVGRIWTFYDITELHREKERLEVFRRLIDGSHDALLIVDPITSEILDCNDRAAELHGYSRADLMECRLIDINVGIRDTAAWRRAVEQIEAEGALIHVVDHIRADGSVFPLENTARAVTANGRRYVVAIERDISERQEMEVALTRERDFSQLLFDLQSTLLAVVDGDRITSCNAALAGFIGAPACEQKGNGVEALYQRMVERPGYLDRRGLDDWLADPAEASTAPHHLLLRPPRAASVHTLLVQRRRLPAPDTRQLLALTDITELEAKRREIERLAATDQLTGLLNRARFNESLDQQLDMVKRYGVNFSLAMFDVDRFKAINDNLGHLVGDQVLERIGKLLRTRLRATDTAARWGGDEFMVLMPKTDAAGARVVIEALRAALADTDFGLGEPLGASFGITCAKSTDTTESLVGRVDEAMYRAKRDPLEGKIALAETSSRQL